MSWGFHEAISGLRRLSGWIMVNQSRLRSKR